MKFLLVAINAKFIHTNPAVYSIKSYIDYNSHNSHRNIGNSLEIVEFTINNSVSDIMADIYSYQPDLLAFSCYIWNWEMMERLLAELPKITPSIPIWLGGPEVSYDGERIMERFPAITGIVLGEGEQTFNEIYELYCEISINEALPEKISQVNGIIFRNSDGSIVFSAQRDLLNIDDLAFSYHDLDGEELKKRIIYYESARGCPYHCSFCLSALDKSIRFKSLEKVKNELAVIIAHEVAQVKFVDRTFNCNHEHAMVIWQFISDNDNGITNFHFEVAADLLSDTEIELLKTFRPGLIQMEIGIQSTNPVTLGSIKRKMNFARLKETVFALKQNLNIHLHLDLIAGLPYEDYDSFANSFNEVYALNPENLQLGFLKVLPGTPIKQDVEKHGIIYEERAPYQVLYTKWLNFSEMQRLHRIEDMVSIFYNTNQFINTIAVLEKAFENPFQMYEKLAGYFVEKNYFRKTPARVFRYQALLDFAIKYDPQNKSCYRELLTHDMYLREKTKTRPDFAHDLSTYRKEINKFYEEKSKGFIRMTTIEVFYYNVNADIADEKIIYRNKPHYILYDYRERNLLTNNAKTINI